MNVWTFPRLGHTAVCLMLVACSGDKDETQDDSNPSSDDSSATDDSGPTDDSSGTDDSAVQSDATVVVNEVLSLNNTTNVDEAGQYEDWLELFNTGTEPVDLAGFQLTDNVGGETPWVIPTGNTLAAGGFLLVWCDEDPDEGALHADFKLDGKDGETVTLLDDAGAFVDHVTYEVLAADIAWARHPDGGETWQAGTPSPLAPNP
jgi:hypothetical protein